MPNNAKRDARRAQLRAQREERRQVILWLYNHGMSYNEVAGVLEACGETHKSSWGVRFMVRKMRKEGLIVRTPDPSEIACRALAGLKPPMEYRLYMERRFRLLEKLRQQGVALAERHAEVDKVYPRIRNPSQWLGRVQ